jgi:hypothetical protein
MLPDLRFAIGAVLASALLIVAAFGLAATVRVAHHQSVTPDDPWRTLSFHDPTDWGLLAERSRPTTAIRTDPPPEVPPGDLAIKTPDPDVTGAIDPNQREPAGQHLGEQRAALKAPPPTAVPTAPAEPTADPLTPAPDPDVVAAIPPTGPAHATETPDIVSPSARPDVVAPSIEDEPLEPSERVGALPNFPTAGPGFVPPEHPIALPALEPSSKAAKSAPKKKTTRRRARRRPAPSAPPANSGYPLGPFPETKFPDNKFPAIGSDWK